MPDLLAHYAVSLLVSSRALKLEYALVFSLIGLLADLDVLLGVHRWITHSIVVVVVVFTALYTSLSVLKLKKYVKLLVLSLLIYTLHPVMDLLYGPVPLLYPLTQQSYSLRVSVDGGVGFNGVTLTPSFEVNVKPVDFTRSYLVEGPLVSSEGLLIALAVAMVLLVEYTWRTRSEK